MSGPAAVTTMRAVLAILRDKGVPEHDLIGTVQVGLMLATLALVECAEMDEARALLKAHGENVGLVVPDDYAFGRYARLAKANEYVIIAAWLDVAKGAGEDSHSPRVLEIASRALTRVEAERLVAR